MMAHSEQLVLVGDGPFAQIAYEYFTYDSNYEVVGFAVESDYIDQEERFSLPVVPFEEMESVFEPETHAAFVAITYNTLNRLRERLYEETKTKGYRLASYVSSDAFVWRNVELGENCFVFEDNTIQPWVRIGDNVVLWSGNHVGHHSNIDDHTFIASHAVVSGFVDIGKYCFVGVNATFVNDITVADNCLVGAGANILDDTEENTVYGGSQTNPAEFTAFEYFGVDE